MDLYNMLLAQKLSGGGSNELVLGLINGNLVDVVIPSGATKIKSSLLSQVSTLRNVVVPEGVTLLEYEAFSSNMYLETVDLPSTITNIEGRAFYNNNKLKLTCRATNPPTVASNTFQNAFTNSSAAIYVPSGSVDTYKSAQYWSNFASIIQAIPE